MKRNILVTSALPYVNNVPHLGNLIGSTLSADVFARFMRSRGHNVLYVCGSDEHGTATEFKAREEGTTPQELCDRYYKIHKTIYDWFGISFDVFGRTSDKRHHFITQEIFLQLDKNGYIREEETEQLYSTFDNVFLADRYVKGTCPHCEYDDARGDQCERCGKLLTPLELINPKSALSGDTPVLKKTKHLFIDLPALQPQLRTWLSGKHFSDNTMRTTDAWLRDGLKPRAITRDLKWGVPVPKPGYENKVFYVWFDAPIGYISMTQDTDSWWRAPDDVELYQFMGKDNIPFHSVLFPAILLGTEEKWTMVKHINTTEFLNYEEGKFSKSRGTGVFGDDAIASGIPADVWRYYLLTNRPEQSDTTFTWKDFQSKLNNELVANLGNLVNRTLSFINQYYDGKVPEYQIRDSDTSFWADVHNEIHRITEELDGVKLKDALHSVMRLSSLANVFFQKHEPWRTRKDAPEEAAATIATLANFLVDLAIVLEPFMPHTAQAICDQLNTPLPKWSEMNKPTDTLKAGHKIQPNKILFEKIEDSAIVALKDKHGGAKHHVQKTGAKTALQTLHLVVAQIVHVEKHPHADKLYVVQVDTGGSERQIVSGLVQHYEKEELIGKHVVLVANLKPAKLRGVESAGMLLAAESGGIVGVVTTAAPKGTLVSAHSDKHHTGEITYEVFSSVELEMREDGLYANGEKLSAGSYSLHADRDVIGPVR